MVDTCDYTFLTKPKECTISRVKPNVNYGHWEIRYVATGS